MSTPSLSLDAVEQGDALPRGMNVRFVPVNATDYTLSYQGVFFHVHRVRLMEQSEYFAMALKDASTESLVLPVLEYETVLDATPIRLVATAQCFMLALAMLYWPDRAVDIFTHTADVEMLSPADQGRGVPPQEGILKYESIVARLRGRPVDNSNVAVYALKWLQMWDCPRVSALCAAELKRVFQESRDESSYGFDIDKPVMLSADFARVINADPAMPMPRGNAIRKLYNDYIGEHCLKAGRNVLPDATVSGLLQGWNGTDPINYITIRAYIKHHFTAVPPTDEGAPSDGLSRLLCRVLWMCETYKVVAVDDLAKMMLERDLTPKSPGYHLLSIEVVREHVSLLMAQQGASLAQTDRVLDQIKELHEKSHATLQLYKAMVSDLRAALRRAKIR